MMENKRRLALVTGVSRTNGLGAAISRKLASEDCDVVFTSWQAYDDEMDWGRETAGPEAVKQDIEAAGGKAYHYEVNLEDPEAPERLFHQIEADIRRPVQVLVNNACCSIDDSIQTVTADALDRHYQVNTRAVVMMIQSFVRCLPRDKEGRIVNIATGWSRGQMPEELSYVVTKSAAETIVHSIHSQLAARHITLNALNPGPTDTGWMNASVKKELTPLFPGGRIGMPEDAARAAAFLCREESSWITGQVLHSEGGFLNRDDPGRPL
ncbi:SDR family oxidoreductase [Alkalicoccus urumqiensis]|uniref:Oxidoreductase n=1 Tax=Alkalicoccus urumqiensis TaxID=1548213 RepID=A0A2P6MI87_ALKUR|nr:SDR family oxidoreductase [Alkalicoccus urumqiensis]PRO65963.1 oxidoreductase [Alkalicoccus urumqiensis]